MGQENDREAGTSGGGLKHDRELGRKIVDVGNSEGFTLPAEWRDKLEVGKGDSTDLELDAESRTVTAHF